MTQHERLDFLLRTLFAERPDYAEFEVPGTTDGQWRLLRSLLNVRRPQPVSEEFLRVQDAYLQEKMKERGVTSLGTIPAVGEQLHLWRGDITLLAADAIVNAANSALLGCFIPCHSCIDNVIHTYAGVQLRLACHELIRRQGHAEPIGQAKLTPAFNLPSRYVLHTVGPAVEKRPTPEDCRLLASCYRSCLETAEQNKVRSLAFCCISTGVFRFPAERAAEIAVETVADYLRRTQSPVEVVFNVFTENDEQIYRNLLGA